MSNGCGNGIKQELNITGLDNSCPPGPCDDVQVALEPATRALACEDGVLTERPVQYTSVVDNEDGTYTVTHADGSVVTIQYVLNEGEGIDVAGTGHPGDPWIVSVDICELDIASAQQRDDATVVLVAACVDGTQRLIPLPENTVVSCGPIVSGMPESPPAPNEPTTVLDCDGSIWFYTCENGWQNTTGGLPDLELIDPATVLDICTNLRFYTHYQEGDCENLRDMTLEQLAEEIQKCICAAIPVVPETATHAMVCSSGENGTEPGTFIEKPLPTLCEQLDGVPDGPAIQLNQLTEIFDPTTCQVRPVVAGDECCACDVTEGFLAGGGVCFQVTANPGVNTPVIFQGRDLTFIRGTGTNAFDLNGVGLVSGVITNPFPDCPCSVRVTMRSLANRSLGNPDTGVSYIFMISETLAEPLPTDGIAIGAGVPGNSATWNYQNISFVPLSVINNYDIAHGGEAENDNYSAANAASAYWETTLAPGQSKTVYGQWWAVLADVAGTAGGTGVIYSHGVMQLSANYIEGGVVNNPIQL